MKPEEKARQRIDALLEAAGWRVQDMARLNLGASLGVAVREFPLESGFANYLLFVDRKAVGVTEAKPAGTTLSGVAEQSGASGFQRGTGLRPPGPHPGRKGPARGGGKEQKEGKAEENPESKGVTTAKVTLKSPTRALVIAGGARG